MILKNRIIPIIAMMICVAVLCLCCDFEKDKVAVNTKHTQLPQIILDAGHGGFDGGASAADGTVEKDINLNIAQKVSAMLRLNGYNVIMTRTKDTGTEDDESVAIAKRKKSDLLNRLQVMKDNLDGIYVSIHLNKFTTSAANGAQVFYTKNYKEAYSLAQSVQKSITTLVQPTNTRVVKQGTDSTYLLKNAAVPAIIVECGFLSNKAELEKLKDDNYQSQMAFAIVGGIMDYLK